MKLYERIGTRQDGRPYHSAIVTTFSVDFGAFEGVMLPQLLAAGCSNVLLLADPRMVAQAMSDGSSPPSSAGRQYVVGAPLHAGGVFHPKIVLQIGRKGARAIIASANATSAGVAGNVEIATEVACGVESSPQRAFVMAVLAYLERKIPPAPCPARDTLVWLRQRTPWLAEAESDGASVWPLDDRTFIGFFTDARPGEASILTRFVGEVGPGPVDRFVAVSPYWDHDLAALRALMRQLSPKDTVVVLQSRHGLFPVVALDGVSVRIVEAPESFGSRFLHAKLLVATKGGIDHVLAGSANCTIAALGRETFTGVNAEASVYRRLETGLVTRVLGLEAALAAPALDPANIAPFRPQPEIPLSELMGRLPGEFEADYGRLLWRPPVGLDPAMVDVEILDASRTMTGGISSTAWSPPHEGRLNTPLDLTAVQAVFARVHGPAGASIPAIIHQNDLLRRQRREPGTAAVERIKQSFSEAVDLDLEQLEWLTKLEEADQRERPPAGQAAAGPQSKEEAEPVHQRLTYDQFSKVRRTSSPQPATVGDALGGYHAAAVQALLNRIVGREEPSQTKVKDLFLEPDDETGELQEPPAGQDEVRGKDSPPTEREPIRPQRPPFDPTAFVRAVATYEKNILRRTNDDRVGPTDVLRLRFLTTLLMSHALRPRAQASQEKGLRCGLDKGDWPRLILVTLAAFFHGSSPAIGRLAMDPAFDQIPDDFVATWATALWALRATSSAVAEIQPGAPFLRHVDLLTAEIYTRTALTKADIAGEAFAAVQAGLEARFGSRLQPAPTPAEVDRGRARAKHGKT